MFRFVTALIFGFLTGITSYSSVNPTTRPPRIPQSFVRNVGQVAFTSGRLASHVDAVFNAGSTTAFIHASGMHVVQSRPSQPADANRDGGAKNRDATKDDVAYDLYRMDLSLIASNKNARIEWLDKRADFTRFLTRPDDLPNGRVADHHKQLYYHDVWPGIDMRLYIVEGGMEYDFIVHPGADPNRIAFYMDGAQEMGLTSSGGIQARTPLGTMSDAAPYSYVYRGIESKSTKVESRFVVDGRSVRFAIGAYDHTQILVIDPRRIWATYFGFNSDVSYLNGAIDPFGNVLLSGQTGATNLPEVAGVLQKRYKANRDGFVAKFDDAGRFLWCTYFGGSGKDRIQGICTDQTGNIYTCGTTESELGTLPPSLGVGSAPFGDPDSLGISNGFVLGLSPTGAWVDHWFLYGRAEDQAVDITFRNDRLAVIGTSRSVRVCERIGTPYRHDDQNNFNNEDIFVCQFKRHATIPNRWLGEWLTFVGGDLGDQGVAVAMDDQGSVYIAANTQGAGTQVTDGSTFRGALDAYVAKFSFAGGVVTHDWGGYVGGNALDDARDIAIDANGAAIVVGVTYSTNFPLRNPLLGIRAGVSDGFVYKAASANGAIQWSTLYGGGSFDVLNSVAVDQLNRVWVCGSTVGSNNIPLTADAFQSTLYNTGMWLPAQGIMGQIRADGQAVLYGSYYGAPPDNPLPAFNTPPLLADNDDLGSTDAVAIACDANANVLLVHLAQTLHMDTTAGAYQDSSKLNHTYHRNLIPFLTLFTNCTDSVTAAVINGSPALCDTETRQIVGPTGFASYLWSTGAITKNITVSDSGRYILTATTAEGCRYRDTVFLTRNTKPIVDAGPELSRCKDTVVTLSVSVTGGTAPYKFKWSRVESGPEYIDVDTARAPKVNPPSTSRYEVVVTDAMGCVSKDTVRIAIVDPKPTVPAAVVDFGVLDACEATKDADVVITNPMPYELRVDAFASDIASIVTSLSPPPIIPANGSITLSVRISPTQVGVTTGTLRFSGSPCSWSISVPYRVEKARLTAAVSPSTLGFGASADCEPVQRDTTVVIRNGSPDPMTVSVGTVSPNGQPFTIISPTTSTVIAPNDTLVVIIRYAPTGSASFSAVASFPFTAGSCSDTLNVNLNATRSAVTIVSAPSIVDVGTLGGCQDAVDTVLTLTNSGDVPVTVTLPTLAGVAFTPPGPLALAVGTSVVVAVRITPAAQGPFSSVGSLLAEPCGIVRTLTYSGTKAGATVTVPTQIDFGELSGCNGPDFATRTFTIVYDGAGNANVVTVTHGPSIRTTLVSGMLLLPGVAQGFDITWSPVADGAFVDSLVLVVEPCSIRRVIRLVGERTNVSLTASTPLVNLGAITGPEIGQVVFVNNGTDTISAVAAALTPDVSVTSTIPTILSSILPGGSIRVNYELNCNGRTDVLDSIRVSALTPCVSDATTAFVGTCSAAAPASSHIVIDSARVSTGDTFLVSLRIVRSTGLNAVNARAWTARVSYNPGVLVGTGATPDCFTGTFAPCSIDIQGTRGNDTVGVLNQLNFRAVLGTDSVTDLTLESFMWTDATVDPITTSNGRVTLIDICQEGGPRLLKPKGSPLSITLRPAPVVQHVTISATELGTDIAHYTMHNIIGTRVASGELVPDPGGRSDVTLDVSSLAAGTYVFSVDARGHVFRQIFFINR